MTQQKVAIVTGSSSGIGFAVAEYLLTQGYFVYGMSRRESVISRKSYHHFSLSLRDTKSLEQATRFIQEENNHLIDLLFLGAGVGYFSPLEEMSIAKIQEMIETNLTAPLVLTKLVLRSLKKTKGKIISISSISGRKPASHGVVYGSSKSGIDYFSKSLFEEVRKTGVQITNIVPDLVDTDFFNNTWFGIDLEEEQSFLTKQDIVECLSSILHLRSGAVIQEVVMRPQYFKIKKRSHNA
jgi:NADP-dependent 3-hydroxy acid dehydrogenase YdfG